MTRRPFKQSDIKAAYDAFPAAARARLLELRDLVFATAEETKDAGGLIETLKWGQPAYLTASGSGSTIRVGVTKKEDGFAMFFHCQTSLVETFREIYPDEFRFEDNRAILFSMRDEIPVDALRHCVSLALTYHSRRKR